LIKATDRQLVRPLHLACKENFLAVATHLVEQGTRIDATDADGWTPLHYAAARGHLDVIRFIRERSSSRFQQLVCQKTKTGANCLHLSVQHGNRQSVEFMLNDFPSAQHKALLNEQVASFGTTFHIAGRPRLVRSSMPIDMSF
jgi:ankyrin repeat protein